MVMRNNVVTQGEGLELWESEPLPVKMGRYSSPAVAEMQSQGFQMVGERSQPRAMEVRLKGAALHTIHVIVGTGLAVFVRHHEMQMVHITHDVLEDLGRGE